MTKRAFFFLLAILAVATCAVAQEGPSTVIVQGTGMGIMAGKGATVTGAPYSATITDESVQTLPDGTRIVQNFSGTTARDSQGRTRQDAPLPPIGNLSAENAPHLVFIMDPVAQVSYTLNLTDKTAQKMPMPSGGSGGAMSGMTAGSGSGNTAASGPVVTGAGAPSGATTANGNAVFIQMGSGLTTGAMPPPMAFQKTIVTNESSEAKTEDLGTQTMEGLPVTGTRTTRTIPAGEIGNDRPISIVTEIWTSPDLKTIVSSKRSDPRMGDQTFQLTNITRAEPDSTLFTVPPDFKVIDGPQKIVYGVNK